MRLSDSRYESIKKDVATLYQKYNIINLLKGDYRL